MSEPRKSRGNFEEEFCGSLMIEKYFRHYLAEGFSDELLRDNTAKAIWRFSREYYEQSQEIPTLEVLTTEFPKYEFAIPNGEPHWLLDKLRSNWKDWQSRKVAEHVVHLTSESKHEEVFDYMKKKVFEAETITRSETHSFGPENINILMDNYFDRLAAGDFKGWTTGWEHVDEITGGFRPGTITCLLGRPKRQKSMNGLKAFVGQKLAGEDPFLFTLEMSPDEIFQRLTALFSGISLDNIVKGKIDFDEIQRMKESWDQIGGMGTYKFSRPPIGQRSVPQMMVEADRAGANSVIIDQLSFIEPRRDPSEYRREDLKHAEIIYDLKAWASRQGHEIPIYYMAQFNRMQEGKDELSAARAALTGAIEQASDSIFGLYSNEELLANNQVKFVIMEGRSHESGAEFYVDYEYKTHTSLTMAERGAFPVELTPDGKVLS